MKDIATIALSIGIHHLGRFCCFPTDFDRHLVETIVRMIL